MPQATGSRLTLPVPADFDLPRAVCSYGYFMLAPNRWDHRAARLVRPLRGRRDRRIAVAVTQPAGSGTPLRLRCDRKADPAEQLRLKAQVRRMLRVDEDLGPWYRVSARARRQRFGRLFRSPTLFEDIVKTITGCNVTWTNTIRMNELLCDRVGGGGFPTPRQLAAIDPPDRLAERCKVGYRAGRIVRLARDVVDGRLDLAALEDPALPTDELFARLKAIHGIGDYAAGNLCQLLGRYDRLAIDTETYRHYCLTQNVDRPRDPKALHRRIEAHYARYHPYQFLAYWHELWGDYESRFGDARGWDPAADGPSFTAANLR